MILTPIDPRTVLSAVNQAVTPEAKKAKDLESLRKSTQEFEAIYINELFKAMRKTIPEGGLFEKDTSTEIYQEMLDMETSRNFSKSKGLGLADAMFEQLRHLVENKMER